MSGTTVDAGGDIEPNADSAAALVTVETPSTHVGTPSSSFPFFYQGNCLSFVQGLPFVADAGLYAALIASSVSVVWSS